MGSRKSLSGRIPGTGVGGIFVAGCACAMSIGTRLVHQNNIETMLRSVGQRTIILGWIVVIVETLFADISEDRLRQKIGYIQPKLQAMQDIA